MKCIYCGENINQNITKCPTCGKITQIVPDYSIYDDDNIHVLLEGTQHISSSKEKQEDTDTQTPKQESEKKKSENIKKQQNAMMIKLVSVICIVLVIIGIVIKISIDTSNQNSLEYQLKKGNALLAEQNYEEALSYFEQADRISPDNCEILFSISEIYSKLGKEQQALDCLCEIVKLDSSHTKAYNSLISYYEKQNDTDSILELMKTTESEQVLRLFKDYMVEMPSVNLKEGTYQEYIKLTLSSKMNTKVYYTLDGSDPIKKGAIYKEQISIDKMGEFTLKAVSKNEKGVYSEVLTQKYVIKIMAPSYPSVSPGSGIYTDETYISVQIPNGCSAYYTWNNTNPTENSTLYVAPIRIPEGRNQVLSVIIIDNNTGLISPIYRGSYDYVPESTEEL